MYQVGHKRTTRWWAIILVTALLLFFLYFIGGLSWLSGLFTRIASPLQGVLTGAGTAISDNRSRAEVIKENEQLNQKLQEVSVDVSKLEALEAENQVLRQQLNFLEGQSYKFITARVVARSAQNNISALIINRGSRDGIKIGYPVIAGEGVLVGRIIEVKDSISTLLLLTDNQSKIAATIQNISQTIGVIEGENGISIKMGMIPRDEEIKDGETIITSGMQENIPRGLLIGLVDKIDATSSELFLKAYLHPLIDYGKLSIVTILAP